MAASNASEGMCFSCSDDDLRDLVDYMVDSVSEKTQSSIDGSSLPKTGVLLARDRKQRNFGRKKSLRYKILVKVH